MKQKFLNPKKVNIKENFEYKFNQIRKSKSKRKVKLYLWNDCDCGTDFYDKIEREVDLDDPLQDGDIVKDFNPNTDNYV